MANKRGLKRLGVAGSTWLLKFGQKLRKSKETTTHSRQTFLPLE